MEKNMKILVTGSNGLVGSAAVDFFKKKGCDVVGIDNNMRSYFFGIEQPEPEFNLDIRNELTMNALFEQEKFDVIIHAAAQPSHDWSKKEPLTDFDVNARGTLILLEATRKYCPEATFIHVSTDKVYGTNMEYNFESLKELETRYYTLYPFNENVKVDNCMHSLFGCSKLAADIYVQEYGRYFGMKTACFRCGCITGKNHKGAEEHGFLAYLAKCIKEGRPYKIFGYKGKQVRDQIHAHDLASAFWEFAQNPGIAKIYNMGGGPERSVSILEAIDLIEKETGKKAITEYIDEPRLGDRVWDIHDVTRFKLDYPNWKYEFSLSDIIKELCEF